MDDPVAPAQLLKADLDLCPDAVTVLGSLLRGPLEQVYGGRRPGEGPRRVARRAHRTARLSAQVKKGRLVRLVAVALTGRAAHLEQKGAPGHRGQRVPVQLVGAPSVCARRRRGLCRPKKPLRCVENEQLRGGVGSFAGVEPEVSGRDQHLQVVRGGLEVIREVVVGGLSRSRWGTG